jgi:menaquinone-dependent protoporphyrinogen IX oxidase
MKQGYTRKEALEIEKKLEENGWKVEMNNLYAIKKDSSLFWYEYDEDTPIIQMEIFLHL